MSDWISSEEEEPLGSSPIMVRIDGKEHIAHWNKIFKEYEVGSNSCCTCCGGYNSVNFEKGCYMYATHWKYL